MPQTSLLQKDRNQHRHRKLRYHTHSTHTHTHHHTHTQHTKPHHHHRADPDDDRISNTHVLVDALGRTLATYSKTHLFDVDTADGVFLESSFTRPGDALVAVEDTPAGTLGLSVCYDLRFPPVYAALRAAGAHTLLVPSAFMPRCDRCVGGVPLNCIKKLCLSDQLCYFFAVLVRFNAMYITVVYHPTPHFPLLSTGAAHWESLLRARAIETQCFVVAAAQVGQNHPKRRSYGHSIIIDPWGEVRGPNRLKRLKRTPQPLQLWFALSSRHRAALLPTRYSQRQTARRRA
jgi:predicted amidohydrolase